eukprot:IDg16187t1
MGANGINAFFQLHMCNEYCKPEWRSAMALTSEPQLNYTRALILCIRARIAQPTAGNVHGAYTTASVHRPFSVPLPMQFTALSAMPRTDAHLHRTASGHDAPKLQLQVEPCIAHHKLCEILKHIVA